jgi:hypothetical protein
MKVCSYNEPIRQLGASGRSCEKSAGATELPLETGADPGNVWNVLKSDRASLR